MKHKSLRAYLKKMNLGRPSHYANTSLVIDGLCFREMYKMSGFPFILGGEYDRFASYLKNLLSIYIRSNIECYVIFNGAANTDIERRKEIHQKIIDRVNAVAPDRNNEYCEPVFVKDVCKDVLKELGIKYYFCMHDSKEALFNLAKKLKCAILTNNIEYVLYGVTVIQLRSVVFEEKTKSISCLIYYDYVCRHWKFYSYDTIGLVLTIVDQDSNFYNDLLEIFECRETHFISYIFHWIRYRRKEEVIDFFRSHLRDTDMERFLDTFTEIRNLFGSVPYTSALKTLLFNNRPRWYASQPMFEYNVGIGKIAIPFINLKKTGIVSGSWLVCDDKREDAMLPAVNIALYAQALLRNSQEVEIKFIGRKHGISDISVIKKILKDYKIKRYKSEPDFDDFMYILTELLPGFNIATLKTVPEDCWILLISLLYYTVSIEDMSRKIVLDEVYSIILSYVLLGPVSDKVGVLKKSNFSVTLNTIEEGNVKTEELKTNVTETCLTSDQCKRAGTAVIDLFYPLKGELKDRFDRDILHTLAEFQHCLQFMNYLNKLCGEAVKCTAYHKTINCTFIYNLALILRNESSPEKYEYIQKLINCSEVFDYYKKIVDTYHNCFSQLTKN